jgi:hypothetical protein
VVICCSSPYNNGIAIYTPVIAHGVGDSDDDSDDCSERSTAAPSTVGQVIDQFQFEKCTPVPGVI